MLRHLPPPPLYFLLCFGVASLLQYLRPSPIASFGFRTGIGAGAVVLLIASALGGSAIVLMIRHGTPIEPGLVPTQLVMSGPFRLTRNPLYVTLLLVMTAAALMLNSVWVLLAVPVLLLVLDRLVVVSEERRIGEAFGDEYASYKSRVRRWL